MILNRAGNPWPGPGVFPVRLGKPREKSLTWVMRLELPGELQAQKKMQWGSEWMGSGQAGRRAQDPAPREGLRLSFMEEGRPPLRLPKERRREPDMQAKGEKLERV